MTGAPWLVSFDPRKRLEALAGRESTGAHYADRPFLSTCGLVSASSGLEQCATAFLPRHEVTLPHVSPAIELRSNSKVGNELGRTPSNAQPDVGSKSVAVSAHNSDDHERVGSNGYKAAKTGSANTTTETVIRQNAIRGDADRGGAGIVEGRDARPVGAASAGSSVGAERSIVGSQVNQLVTVPRASGLSEANGGGRKALPDQLQTIRPRAFRSLSSHYLVSLTG